jgi:hypothetical protein
MTCHSHPLLATDNLSLPASDNYLDSRLEFSLRETKQFKSAKRRVKDNEFLSYCFILSHRV